MRRQRNLPVISAVFITAVFFVLCSSTCLFADDDSALKEKTPQASEPYSVPLALTLDFIPGGGHFYTDSYIFGSIFAAAKIAGFCSSWYLLENWQKDRRYYRDARRTRNSLGLSDGDPLAGPDGRTRSVTSYRRDSDRSAEYFTLSILGNAAIWTASWLLVWRNCEQHNFKSIPAFDVGFDLRAAGSGRETYLRCGATMQF